MTHTPGRIVSRDAVAPVHWMGEEGRFLLRSEDTGGLYTFFEVTTSPGGGPPLHIHEDADEAFYVIAGRYAIHLGDEEHEAPAGCLVYGPRGVPHKFRNISGGPSKLLVIATPGGVEGFFEGLSGLMAAGAPPAASDMIELAAAFRVQGLEPVGPPPGVPGRPPGTSGRGVR
ncbi:cupin domain-containing protein [Actinomadura alba]|uniref:Cupin domain-containing protein n=1 Tax=Actinomadura alba TaxID=406431 RepID=A0ABR7LU47_9ACTN|nr:cupin domain-containing protein [Actinomadura alba]MBC6468365.1 cupin domain-containing protein [Actinomadura alba]